MATGRILWGNIAAYCAVLCPGIGAITASLHGLWFPALIFVALAVGVAVKFWHRFAFDPHDEPQPGDTNPATGVPIAQGSHVDMTGCYRYTSRP